MLSSIFKAVSVAAVAVMAMAAGAFAQNEGETVDVSGQTWIVESNNGNTMVLRKARHGNPRQGGGPRQGGRQQDYNIGDTGPGGGIIFYVSAQGFRMADNGEICHYLEAAPANGGNPWPRNTDIAGTGSAIGAGRNNTAIIRRGAGANINTPYFENDGMRDWFLPSKDELAQLYANRSYVGNMGISYYLSSSQSSAGEAWVVNFKSNNASPEIRGKSASNFFRPIRAF